MYKRQGLAIEKQETRWEEYPVLHLDLNARKYETAGDLLAMLNQYLEKWELKYGAETVSYTHLATAMIPCIAITIRRSRAPFTFRKTPS